MKLHKILVALILLSIFNTLPAKAQFLPENMITDASFRVEYLLGRQSVGKTDDSIPLWGNFTYAGSPAGRPLPNPVQSLNISFITSQLVLDGLLEMTPVPEFSGRLRAAAKLMAERKTR